ncbi:helix-turn-helix transcriptional regulator [Niallia nealsonii]|uniref:Transcriptional regulator n=1 Tax=Niallia nealsonii TaxID=115979 RepID=A0A2N0Z555_9BACI|nr:metalloregulator ArsR/SmtB family transcription factor [Niallia nealsonii]PKG24646.1 transcriptional regulator [Niallia nealsonii]
MDTKQKNTKDKLLHLLKKEAFLTVNDLTDRLKITHMAIRKHLASLEKDGLILSKEEKQAMGRPIQVYFLSNKAEHFFPKNYEGLSIEFLHDIKELYGEESITQLFNKREKRLIEQYSMRMQGKKSSEKVNEMVIIQNEKGYMADLSQIDETTYELMEYNCPLLEIAKEFKIACRCETDMLKKVLETNDIQRTLCRTDGDNLCKFTVEFKST